MSKQGRLKRGAALIDGMLTSFAGLQVKANLKLPEEDRSAMLVGTVLSSLPARDR